MTHPLAIEGHNLVLRCPPGCPNCHDIYVREEIIDGTLYRFMEVDLSPADREAVANGGTLMIGQMGGAWVPVSTTFLDAAKRPVLD